MSFGDWELFRMVIVSLREQELTTLTTQEEGPRSVRFIVGTDESIRKGVLCYQILLLVLFVGFDVKKNKF